MKELTLCEMHLVSGGDGPGDSWYDLGDPCGCPYCEKYYEEKAAKCSISDYGNSIAGGAIGGGMAGAAVGGTATVGTLAVPSAVAGAISGALIGGAVKAYDCW